MRDVGFDWKVYQTVEIELCDALIRVQRGIFLLVVWAGACGVVVVVVVREKE